MKIVTILALSELSFNLIVILDNSPILKSKKFKAKIKEWKE